MTKFIIANIGCLLGAGLSVAIFGPLPKWLVLAIFLIPLLAANAFLLESKQRFSRAGLKGGLLPLTILVGLTLWLGFDHYYKQRWVSLFFEGKSAFESGDYRSAEHELEDALRLSEASGSAKGICKIQNYLSNTYMDEGKHTSAQEISLASVSSCASSDDVHDLVAAYVNLATAYQYGGKSKDADDAFRHALDLSNRRLAPDDSQRTAILNNYGTLKESEGNYPEAERYLRQAVETCERLSSNESAEIASSYNNLGHVLFLEGKADEAESLFKKSLDIYANKYVESAEFATVLNNLATLYEQEGRRGDARALYQSAISRIERTPSSNRAQLEVLRKKYQQLLQDASH